MTAGTLDISEARKQFNRLDERLRKEPVIKITRHGKDAFAVISVELLEAVAETLDILNDPEALNMLRDSLDDIRAGRLHDHDDVKKELM